MQPVPFLLPVHKCVHCQALPGHDVPSVSCYIRMSKVFVSRPPPLFDVAPRCFSSTMQTEPGHKLLKENVVSCFPPFCSRETTQSAKRSAFLLPSFRVLRRSMAGAELADADTDGARVALSEFQLRAAADGFWFSCPSVQRVESIAYVSYSW